MSLLGAAIDDGFGIANPKESAEVYYLLGSLKLLLEEVGEEDVFRKVRGDFDTAGVDRTDARIREQMAELMPIAREQIMKDIKE